MSSDDEKETFEVTDRDLLEELQPKRFFQSKNKATYGIWADDDSDDDERGARGGFGKTVPHYAAAMNFVSGGIKGGEKPNVKDEDNVVDAGTSSESEEEIMVKTRPTMNTESNTFHFTTGFKADNNFGNWEKYTKGIGAKLLQKMGHVSGKGLGKNAQGIINPIEANQRRKGRATVGAYGSEVSKKARVKVQQVDSEEDEDERFREKLNQWKKGDDKKMKPKYVYHTAEEIIAKGSKRQLAPMSKMSNVKVIDMTGKEKIVLTGYRAISARHDKPKEESEDLYVELKAVTKVFDMPELIHNLDLLVDMAEDEIIQNDKKMKHAKDIAVSLKYEHEKLTDVVQCEEEQVKRLQNLVSAIDSMNSRINGLAPEPLSFDECGATYKYLKDAYSEEFLLHDIALLAVVMVKPMMKDYFSDWRPLREPKYGLKVMALWRDVLHQDNSGRYGYNSDITDPYDTLMWDVWMPQIRGLVSNCNIRDCDALIQLMEEWIPLLSPWITNNILVQLVLPKIQEEVEKWNPLTDTVPIHSWIHPWLPLMGTRLEPVYEPIRLKLGNALRNWHPSDPSARLILQPWLAVFNKGHMDAFLIKHIVPKLHLSMSEFIINPHQQHLDSWNWVLSWKDVIPLHTMISLLDKTFFPKWHQVLASWLNSNPNFEEIAKWFSGWKAMLPEDMMSSPIISDHFSQALGVMNRAVSGKGPLPAALARERSSPIGTMPASPGAALPPNAGVPQSFKELVERKAVENSLLFMPVHNRLREGKQVYKFGKALIYLDRNVIFVNDKGSSWIPVSLNTLVDHGNGSI